MAIETTTLTFSAPNQSMFGGTSLIGLSDTVTLLPLGSVDIPTVPIPILLGGAVPVGTFDVDMTIGLGLDFSYTFTPGDIDLDYAIDVSLDAPDIVAAGSDITIDTSEWSIAGATIVSQSPDAGFSFDITYDFAASLSLDLIGFDPIHLGTWNPEAGSTALFGFSTASGLDGLIGELHNGEQGWPYSFDFGFGEAFASLPEASAEADTTQILEGGNAQNEALGDPFAGISLDIPAMFNMDWTDGSYSNHGTTSSWFYDLSILWSIFSLELEAGLNLAQRFTFDPADLQLKLTASTGESLTQALGTEFIFSAPSTGDGEVTFTAEYFLTGGLTTETGMALSFGLPLSMGEIQIGSGPIRQDEHGNDYINGQSFTLGPVVDIDLLELLAGEPVISTPFYPLSSTSTVSGFNVPTQTFSIAYQEGYTGTGLADPNQNAADELAGGGASGVPPVASTTYTWNGGTNQAISGPGSADRLVATALGSFNYVRASGQGDLYLYSGSSIQDVEYWLALSSPIRLLSGRDGYHDQNTLYFSGIEQVDLINAIGDSDFDAPEDLMIYMGGARYHSGSGMHDAFYADWSGETVALIWDLDQSDASATILSNGVSVQGIDRIMLRTGSGDDRIATRSPQPYSQYADNYIDTGAGDDFVELRNGSEVLLGEGNDTVVVGDLSSASGVLDGGAGGQDLIVIGGRTSEYPYQFWWMRTDDSAITGYDVTFASATAWLAGTAPILFSNIQFENFERVDLIGSWNEYATGPEIYLYMDGTRYLGGIGDQDVFYADWSDETRAIVWDIAAAQTSAVRLGNGVLVQGMDRLLVRTGSGADKITAGVLDDYIDTGAGNDTVNGGSGRDTILLGDGDDSAAWVDRGLTSPWFGPSGEASIDGGAGTDRLVIDFAPDLVSSWTSGPDSLSDILGEWTTGDAEFAGIHAALAASGTLTLRTYLVSLTFSNFEHVDMIGGTGSDLLIYMNGTRYFGGSGGIDTFYADWSSETRAIIWDLSKPQTDVTRLANGVSVQGIDNVLLRTGSGNDVITGSNSNVYGDYIDTGGGNDTVNDSAGSDIIELGAGNDTGLWHGRSDYTKMDGGTGADSLVIDTTASQLSDGALLSGIRWFKEDASHSRFYVDAQSDVASLKDWAATGGPAWIYFTGNSSPQERFFEFSNFEHVDQLGSLSGDNAELLIYMGGKRYHGGAGNLDAFYADWSDVTQALVWDTATTQTVASMLANGVSVQGADRLILQTGAGNDRIAGGDNAGFWWGDYIDGGAGNDFLEGRGGADTLIGGAGEDYLIGGSGDDEYRFAAGWGSDEVYEYDDAVYLLFSGFAASDLAFARDQYDLVITRAGSTDKVRVASYFAESVNGRSAHFYVGDTFVDFDPLTIPGAVAPIIANRIAGTILNDVLQGGSASEQMFGGGADDIIKGGSGHDKIYGEAGNDRLDGQAGDDWLEGASGNDFLTGGAGRDTASFASSIQGVTVNLASGSASGQSIGTDKLREIENVTGSKRADTLTGNSAANDIDGLGGADRMTGGGGHDTYHVDSTSDVIAELSNGGTDTVHSSVSLAKTSALAAFVENLVLIDAANPALNNLSATGNALANKITGNRGNNTLDGGADALADTLAGLAGNDIYYVNATDIILEVSGQGTADRVRAYQTFKLAAADHIEFLETAAATASSSINLTGNSFGQTITGNAGVNILTGGAGKDVLVGNGGHDRFVFTTASDSVVGTNRDTITDFSIAGTLERIDLSGFLGTFSFRGTAAFSSTSKEVSYSYVGANTLVKIDLDADTAAEMEILLIGRKALTAADFYL